MREQLIKEEQQRVNQTILEIEEVISELQNSKRRPEDIGQARVEAKRKERIFEYSKALSEPYIGKIELIEGEKIVTYRIGKIPVAKDEITDIIYDWRTPYGNAYYGFNGGEGNITIQGPEGHLHLSVNRKRAVHIRNQKVIDVRDTLSNLYRRPEIPQGEVDEIAPNLIDDRLTQIWFEKSTDHQIKEIIATIQKEQNEIIRLGISKPILVQGVAGSGKTSIALHRISYLLYEYAKQLSADKILILAPNQIFLSYMKQVTKDLDIEGIRQSTVIDFAGNLLPFVKTIKTPQEWLAEFIDNPPDVMAETADLLTYKTSLSFKQQVDRFLSSLEEEFLPKEMPRLIFYEQPQQSIEEKLTEIYNGYKHLPLNKRRAETIQSIKNWAEMELKKQKTYLENRYLAMRKEWTGDLPDDLVIKSEWEAKFKDILQIKIRRMTENWQQELEKYFDTWKPLNTLDCYITLCEEQKWNCEDLKKKNVGYEDLGALIHMKRRIDGIDVTLDYLVIDEVQDLYAFLIDSIKPLSKSMTMLGDITQCIYPWIGFRDWASLQEIFGSDLHYIETTVSYRSTYEIMELANHILKRTSTSLPEIQPINRHGNHPHLVSVEDGSDLVQKLKQSIDHLLEAGHQKIAVICKEIRLLKALYAKMLELGVESLQMIEDSKKELQKRVVFIPISLVKGLEFDAVIIPNANSRSFSNELDAKLLFVSVTRAQEALHLFYFDQLSPFLSEYGAELVHH
jgi:DNA helicase-2/ATP-dependent DNA helicase PcrA